MNDEITYLWSATTANGRHVSGNCTYDERPTPQKLYSHISKYTSDVCGCGVDEVNVISLCKL